jgi:hypothetical protein
MAASSIWGKPLSSISVFCRADIIWEKEVLFAA